MFLFFLVIYLYIAPRRHLLEKVRARMPNCSCKASVDIGLRVNPNPDICIYIYGPVPPAREGA